MGADKIVQPHFQYGIGDDLIGCLGCADFVSQIEIFAAKQKLVGINIQIFVKNLLSPDNEICHLVLGWVDFESGFH